MPALQRTVFDLVAEYERKREAMEAEVSAFKDAFVRLELAASVQGTYVGRVVEPNYVYPERLCRLLLQSGWQALYNRLQIDRIASAKDKRLFDKTLANPPELTVENARATFGHYFEDPKSHILRGLAEAFVSLDPAFKSHQKVKIGVKGLPKRIILPSWGGYSSSWGRDRFRDMANALAVYQRKPLFEHTEMLAIDLAHRQGVDAILDGREYVEPSRYDPEDPEKATRWATVDRGMKVRAFANGNAHVFFDKETLLDVNRALAEFYGDVLPDVDGSGEARTVSTALAKDLQYYWSPEHVVAQALEFASISDRAEWRANPPLYRVLEPSCGDGRILDGIRGRGHQALGIECHAGRAAEARAKGHAVILANFLEYPAVPEFDAVVMNPPFYGKHYLKHVRHALKFLKPGGVLVAILPASAYYDHDDLDGEWKDLPLASFAESGTKVGTGMLKIRAPR